MMVMASAFPAPGSAEAIGWLLMGLAALCVAANQIFAFVQKYIREQPVPSVTYLTLPRYNEEQAAIRKSLEKIEKSLELSKAYQAKARKGIYARINGQENALYFMAGQMDPHASRVIRERLEKGHKDMEDAG